MSVVHGVITAAFVTGVLAIHGLGSWLTIALGHRPRPCLDDIDHWSFQLASWTTGCLLAVALYGSSIWVLTTVLGVWMSKGEWKLATFATRITLVLVALTTLVLDPFGGWNWVLD